MERIEAGSDGWQGTAWILERLYPTRFSKPEVQISLGAGVNASANHLTITISVEDAQKIERQAVPIREAASKLLEEYQPMETTGTQESARVNGEAVDAGRSQISEIAQTRIDEYLRTRR